MEATTIRTRTLEIDGMSCEACVQKVTDALRNVHGVSTQSVKVGSATIGADQAGCSAACAAIGGAGFKAREGAKTAQANGATRATPMNSSGNRSGYQTSTQTPNAAGTAPVGAASSSAAPIANKTGEVKSGLGAHAVEATNGSGSVKPAVATH
jgi:copper chaperone